MHSFSPRLLLATLLLISQTCHAAQQLNPTGFVENVGQVQAPHYRPVEQTLYAFSSNGLNVSLRSNGFSYDIVTASDSTRLDKQDHSSSYSIERIDFDFSNASPEMKIIPVNLLPGILRFYTMGSSDDSPFMPKQYQSVLYRNVQPGIDILFTTSVATSNNSTGFEYSVIQHSGADLSALTLTCIGAPVQLIGTGESVEFKLANHSFRENIPSSYIATGSGSIRQVQAHYLLSPSGSISFISSPDVELAQGDSLVIDPIPALLWSTPYGSYRGNDIKSTASDIYSCGNTAAVSGISTTGAHQVTYGGNTDGCLARFSSSGALIWGTYYGGENYDDAASLTTFGKFIYVVGSTSSTTNIATPGAFLSVAPPPPNAYMAKFDYHGVRLWSTYFGGPSIDGATAVVVDGSGNPYLAGPTYSQTNIATFGAFQYLSNGGADIMLAKFYASTGMLAWATYYGGTNSENEPLLAADGDKIYLSFYTDSTSPSLLATTGTHQANSAGQEDVFLAQFNSAGARNWATYYGGTFFDLPNGIDVGCNGDIYICGRTNSLTGIATAGSFQSSIFLSFDAFLAKFNTTGNLIWGTYFGSGDADNFWSVSAAGRDQLFVSGTTSSTTGISTSGAYQVAYGGGTEDGLIAQFSTDGASRIWASYLGSTGTAESYAIHAFSGGFDVLNTSSNGMIVDRFDAPMAKVCFPAVHGFESLTQDTVQALVLSSPESSLFRFNISKSIADRPLSIEAIHAVVFRIDGSHAETGTAIVEGSNESQTQLTVQLPLTLQTGVYIVRISDGSSILRSLRLVVIE